MNVISAIITFDEIFSWLFNPVDKTAKEQRLIQELPVHIIERSAIQKLKHYCQKHNLPLEVKNIKENVISIEVKV